MDLAVSMRVTGGVGCARYPCWLMLWSFLLATFAAMGTRGKAAAFALPHLASSVTNHLRCHVSPNTACRHPSGNNQHALWHAQTWPIIAPQLALRGGARSLSVALAKSRGARAHVSADDASMGDEEEESKAKQPRVSKGDLVDIDAKTGAELRRRAR